MLPWAASVLGSAPTGDGHPVLLVPGFATDDAAMRPLGYFLEQLGYDVRPWQLGYNLDHHSVGEDGEHLLERIRCISEETGQAVSLVGWSLGGVVAREAARRDPRLIRQVISLGSPFCGNPKANRCGFLFEMLTGTKADSPASIARFASGASPLPVPATAIYSKSDGITAWQNCVTEADDHSENIEVYSSHFGLVVSPTVFYAVADRLAQPADSWTAFERSGWRAVFYPAVAAD